MLDIRTHDTTPAAPGDLEVLQRFLNLHDHEPGVDDDLPPTPEMVRTYLVDRGLLAHDASYDDEDHARALSLYRAIHGRLRTTAGSPSAAEHEQTIEDVAARAGLHVRFGDEPSLEPAGSGVEAALGRLVALLFLAELLGEWSHMKECASETCTAVFYDRSRNRSGRWCSMQSCGNRQKVRAWRERHRSEGRDEP